MYLQTTTSLDNKPMHCQHRNQYQFKLTNIRFCVYDEILLKHNSQISAIENNFIP